MEIKDLDLASIQNAFAPFIQPEHMKTLLQAQLPFFSNGRQVITSCKIGYTKYKTYQNPASYGRSNLSICYHLEISDPLKQKSGEQVLYAKVYLENRSQIEFEKIKTEHFVAPKYGEPCVHLPELDMLVWAFPNDPLLSHLPECTDPEKVKHYFPYDKLPSGLDGPDDLLNVTVEIVHYRPEVRCTTRYRLEWGSKDAPETITLFGKTFTDDQGFVLFERSTALLRETKDHPGSFLIAEALGYNKKIKTIWQAGLSGKPLAETLNENRVQPLIEAVGRGLALFHQSALQSPLKITLDEHLIEIRKKIEKLIRAFPQLTETLQTIEAFLEKEAPQFLAIPDALIHADFSIQQLLVCGDEVACFDFDEFAMGDPTQDVANFIVDCHFRAFAPELVERMISIFVQSYKENAGFEIQNNRLNWYIKVLFVTKAYRFHLQQKPKLEKEIKSILSLAQGKMSWGRDSGGT